MATKAKSTKKPPMPDKYAQAAGGRYRRSRRVYAESEVGRAVTRREALARHPLAIAGALITTASAVVFIALAIAMLAGLFDNPYAGLVVFIAIPAAVRHRTAAHPGRDVAAAPQARARSECSLGLADPGFPPRPAFAARRSPSSRSRPSTSSSSCWPATAACTGWSRRPSAARCVIRRCSRSSWPGRGRRTRSVACVHCHVGEGAERFVHAKLAGVRQLVHVVTNSVSQADSAGAEMPPGRRRKPAPTATSPGMSLGDRVRVIREYADDENELRNDDGAADAPGRGVLVGARRFTGTPIPRFASSTWRQTRRRRPFRT